MRIRVLIVTALIAPAAGLDAGAQSSFDARAGGSIVAGYDSRACDSPIQGAIRYLSAQSKVQVCRPASGNSCPSIGNPCSDGSIYAGVSPDGAVAMFTTPADAPSLLTWNNGTSNWIDTAMVNCTSATPGGQTGCRTGAANTTLLVGLSHAASPYAAAAYCAGLDAHGHQDWYLPAWEELDVLYDNRAAIGAFNTTGSSPAAYYWSSSEFNNYLAWVLRFSNGALNLAIKNVGQSARCVRKSSNLPPTFGWTNWGE